MKPWVLLVGVLVVAGSAQSQSLAELLDQKYPQNKPKEPEPQPDGKTDTRETKDCVCVPYYQCVNGSVNQNGVDIIDIRLGNPSSTNTPCTCAANDESGIKDGPCEDYLDVCCQTPSTEPVTTPRPYKRIGCGERHPEGVGFRISGTDNEAQFGEFPWMVAVLKFQGEKNVYQCGGALIHPQVVLTAAHCVVGKKPSQMKIRAGEWDTQTKKELLPYQDRNVEKIVVNKGYYAGALHNDVALMFLNSPVDIADNVDIVCLPKQGDVMDQNDCLASGWGKDVFGEEGKYQVILKKVELPIVPRDKCENALRNTRLGQYFTLHESFICAGGEPGRDTCKGDGGSPLVCPIKDHPGRYQQAGIVAWGIGCGDTTPAVYVNVALFRTWIDEQLVKNGLSADGYDYH